MKNITKYLIFSISITFAFASCNVQKRLHNPGYHVQLNKSYKVDKKNSIETKTTLANTIEGEIEHEVINPTVIASSNEAVINYPTDNSDVASNDESISFQNTISPKRNLIQDSYSTVNQPTEIKTQEITKKSKLEKATKDNNAANGSSAGGLALLFLIILCFFPLINLIPVFITDGGVTLNFWVTLILNLTYIGAVIFSLLVVLGIVSLA